MKLFVILILAVFGSEKKENGPENAERYESNENNSIVVKIEEDDYAQLNKKSKFIGVCYLKRSSKWKVQRRSRNENTMVNNGCYDDEETAAHASDTLARKLMENCKQKFKLNFPDDHIEVYPEKGTSNYIGVTYKNASKWCVQRWNRNENKLIYNGSYHDEETAAHASDTLAIKLMKNGEQKLKLNFPDDHTEVHLKTGTSKYIGVTYNKDKSKWCAQRWNKDENTIISNGSYNDEETAAHASDTLARKLMDNGEQKLKLNFPNDHTEVYPAEKTNSSQYIGVAYNKNTSKWIAQRWSKKENKIVKNGQNYNDEETAAHASDILARKLMVKGEDGLKINFPDDHTEVYREEKKTSSKYIGVTYNKKESKWRTQRRGKNGNFSNGSYNDEQTAAHASDTLAIKLMENGKQKLKLNFPDDSNEVYLENRKIKRKRTNDILV